MPQQFVNIRGIDPLLFRDGRPFTADAGGLTARSLPLPLPTTIAGFVRSQVGLADGRRGRPWSDEECQDAHTIPVHGPLLTKDGKIVLPAPKDALLEETGDGRFRPVRLEPRAEMVECCDLPSGMLPVMPRKGEQPKRKPPSTYRYWPVETMLGWLEGTRPDSVDEIEGLPQEERIGIEIDPLYRRAMDGQLYTTQLRPFGDRVVDKQGHVSWHHYSLTARLTLPNGQTLAAAGTLGGERRLTVVEVVDDTPDAWPRCPQQLKDRLANADRVRMVLATPACFEGGWLPGWIDSFPEGVCASERSPLGEGGRSARTGSGSGRENLPAGIGKVGLKLVGAALDRRVPVSGWGLREGPRAVRWLVPAGSVYFFEVIPGGDPKALCDAWMKPMSDNEVDRRDGLGLALWGTW